MPRKKKFIEPVIEWTPVSVRFTPDEHEQIKRAAKRRGQSVNRFIRQASQLGAERVLQAEASSAGNDEMRRIMFAD